MARVSETLKTQPSVCTSRREALPVRSDAPTRGMAPERPGKLASFVLGIVTGPARETGPLLMPLLTVTPWTEPDL